MDNSRRPLILFSTTRMWNPGDDFILMGIRRLLDQIIGRYNALVYNRNPDLHLFRLHLDHPVPLVLRQNGEVTREVQVNFYEKFKDHLWTCDDSWRENFPVELLDMVIFAGTPEWIGEMVQPLSDKLQHHDVPIFYLGIGTADAFQDTTIEEIKQRFPSQWNLLEKAELITVRDERCSRILSPFSTPVLPCPALLAAPHQHLRTEKKRVALSMQGKQPTNKNSIDESTWNFCVELFRQLIDRYDCKLICHYSDDVAELAPVFGHQIEIRYSYDAEEYLDFYNDCDLTVTTRVHGAGICASLGIPGIFVSHTTRGKTTQGFLADTISTGDSIEAALNAIDSLDVPSRSQRLIEHKQSTFETYLDILTPSVKNALFQKSTAMKYNADHQQK